MANIVREQQNFLPLINGVQFEQIAPGVSVSADVPDEVAEVFLAVDGYRLAGEDDEVPEHLVAVVKDKAPKETAAQRKAREKAEAAEAAEKAKQEQADKEAAEKAAAEEAAKKEAEEKAAAEEAAKNASSTDQKSDEVF